VGKDVLLGVSHALPQRAGSQRSPILGFLSSYAYILCRRNAKFHLVTHSLWGRAVFPGVQPCRHFNGARSERFPVLGFPSAYILCRRITEFDRWPVGEIHAFWSQRRLTSQGSGVPACLNVGVVVHLWQYPLTHDDRIRHGDTYGEGRVLRMSATPGVRKKASRGLSATAEFLVLLSSIA